VQASASNPYAARGHQHAFRTLVSRVREAMPYTFAGATAQETALAARVVRPSANSVRGIVRNGAYHGPSMGQTAWYARPRYFTPYYDPWDVYYRDPQYDLLDLLYLNAWVHQASKPVGVWEMPFHVVKPDGEAVCELDHALLMKEKFAGLDTLAGWDYGRPVRQARRRELVRPRRPRPGERRRQHRGGLGQR
jgi:hypothetical protein